MTKIDVMRFRKLLESNDLNYTNLADKIGVDRSTVSGWANGKQKPSTENLSALEEALGIDRSEFTIDELGGAVHVSPSPDNSVDNSVDNDNSITVNHITVHNIDSLYLIVPDDQSNIADILSRFVIPGNSNAETPTNDDDSESKS